VVRVDDTYVYRTPQGITCVGVTVALIQPGGRSELLVGTARVRDDVYRTYVDAVLDATNRRLPWA
jgi:hypothetical protein